MSVRRRTVSMRALKWRAAYNRHLATSLLLALAVLVGWRSVNPPERVVVEQQAATGRDLAAGVFAERFVSAFLAFDAADPAARERALAEFDGSQEGVTGQGFVPPAKGARRVRSVSIVRDIDGLPGGSSRFVVEADTRPGGRTYVAVDVRRNRGSLQLVGLPAIVGAPLEGGAAPALSGPGVDDDQVETVVTRTLRNYLAARTNDLEADLTGDAVVSTPAAPMELVRVALLEWEPDAPTSVLATVSARDRAGMQVDLLYELALVRRGARWFVGAIHTNPSIGR